MPAEDLADLRRRLAEAEVDRAQLAELRRALERAEQDAARVAPLEQDLQHARRRLEIFTAERERERAEAAAELAAARADLERAQQALADLQGSPSWRVTQPLRTAKRRLG